MFKIGLSTCGKVIDEALFRAYKDAGIAAMEVSPERDEFESIDYKGIKMLSEKYNIDLWSFHLPFLPFKEIDASRRELQAHTVEYLGELIKKASDIGIERYVLHASGEPSEEEDRRELIDTAKETVYSLSQIAKACGGCVAVESLPRTCIGRTSAELLELLSADDSVGVCFDTNHLLIESHKDFIKAVGNRIVTTHISDYDFINERHWLPGEGKTDWQSLIKDLNDSGYNGVWMYEIGFKCPANIIRNRDLTCEDFANNARELFEGKKPTIFSEPKPGLGFSNK